MLYFVGDFTLKVPFLLWVQVHSALSNRSSYVYEFSYAGNVSVLPYDGPAWLHTGASHTDELPYVFGDLFLPSNGKYRVTYTSYNY